MQYSNAVRLARTWGGLAMVCGLMGALVGCGEHEQRADVPAQTVKHFAVDGDPDKFWDRDTGLTVGVVRTSLAHSAPAADVRYVDTYSYRYEPTNQATHERVAITGCATGDGTFMVLRPMERAHPWSYHGTDMLSAIARRVCALH